MITKDIPLKNVRLESGFMGGWQDTVATRSLSYQWETLDGAGAHSPAIKNIRIAAGADSGEFDGLVFTDSDLYKWAEAAALTLAFHPDPAIEARIDELADLLGKAQRADGYLNTYYQLKAVGQEWTNLRDNHEMYCAGHLFEAAAAYYEATGKTNLLEVAIKLADHIDARFGPEPGKVRGYCGHPEIELALIKLFHTTGNERYLKLAKFFVDERGQNPSFYMAEAKARGEEKLADAEKNLFYFQAHAPVRDQPDITGHSVRALYLASAMADIARETGDKTLAGVCEKQFSSASDRRMYITGGVGSHRNGERFSFDYDLPSGTAYAETCATISLAMFAYRMIKNRLDSRYADVMERALLNGSLSGISLDGTRYFYANPLWVWPEASEKRDDTRHNLPERPKWYRCACCPPNIARTIALFGRYAFTASEDALCVHLYPAARGHATLSGVDTAFDITGGYPWNGDVSIALRPEKPVVFTLALRVPHWSGTPVLTINGVPASASFQDGYLHVDREWKEGDNVTLSLPMGIRVTHANPRARQIAGLVALERGPFVYCFEEYDNGPIITALSIDPASFTARFEPGILSGVITLCGRGTRDDESSTALYDDAPVRTSQVNLKAIPYYAWANRGKNEMSVWMRRV